MNSDWTAPKKITWTYKKEKKLAYSESVYTSSLSQVHWGNISLAREVFLDLD